MSRPILDIHDDPTGAVLTRLVPDRGRLPAVVKTASADVSTVPDEEFALLMFGEDGKKRRKYACADPGNTLLSVLYFVDAKDRLPADMRKVAAHNLQLACAQHGITAPGPLRKEAGDDQDPWYQLVYFDEHYLDATSEAAPVVFSAAGGNMPLDTVEEVKQACAWFEDTYRQIHPVKRRALAVDIEKRAYALGVSVPDSMSEYVGDSYAPGFQGHLEARQSLMDRAAEEVGDQEKEAALRGYDELLKVASEMKPEVFAHAVRGLDERYGLHEYWDSYLVDPYAAVLTKAAKAEYEHTDGVDKVTATDLERMAVNNRSSLLKAFPEDLVDGFCKNPVAIFDSLPRPQKKIMMRLAQDNDFPGGEAN
jgi:hypothetical protein